MPGIVGLITRMPRAQAEPQLRRMLQAISHEPFYSRGSWCDEGLGLYAGWTAIEGSFSDRNPAGNGRRDVTMIFSGEEYGGAGAAEPGLDDLVRMYERDPDFPRSLGGMFHGVIADCRRGMITLFNDRFGMHRLYYHGSRDDFYFASEAKAILAVRPDLAEADPRGLGEFLALSCVLENRTIFRGIRVLPGGSLWTFRQGRPVAQESFFSPSEWERQQTLSPEAYYEALRSSLRTTLPRYFGGRQPMGIAMTGGLDTRVILACHPPAPGTLPSYTFGSMFRDSYDVRVGRHVARILDQPHSVIEVGEEFLREFPRHAERTMFLTEGTVDIYRASDLYVSTRARRIAPVKIVGTYGSEIVRAAVMFKPSRPPAGIYQPEFLAQVESAAETYRGLRRAHPVTFAAFMQSPWYHHGVLAIEQSQLTVRSPFMDNDFVRTVYQAPWESFTNGDVRLRLIREHSRELGRIHSDRGVGGRGGLGSMLLHGYREFSFKAEYAYDYGMPPMVVKVDHALSALRLERLFLGRHKLLHFRVWYRDQLAGYVRGMLLDPASLSRPYLNRPAVERVVNSHLRGVENHTLTLHKLISLELLHRLFLEGRRAPGDASAA